MALASMLRTSDVLILLVASWLLYKIVSTVRQRARSTPLRGPPSQSFLFGLERLINEVDDSGALYEEWAREHGVAYQVPGALGSKRVVVCDPKAIAHVYSKETFGYLHPPFAKAAIEKLLGRGLIWSEGESHKRQRKALSPAFSNAAIRRLTQAKASWDTMLDTNSDEGAMINVQDWMNHISLDTIGIAGFSHDFRSLDGERPAVVEVFESFTAVKPTWISLTLFILTPVLPVLLKLPTPRGKLVKRLNTTMSKIADELLTRTRKERQEKVTETAEEKSIIGLLIKAEGEDAELHMTQEEVTAQMNVLMIAGFETTSTSLTWALIELSKKIEVQTKLREELSKFGAADPTWEQLMGSLPYLDAIVHEVLRLHPPVDQTTRVTAADDVVPLSGTLQTASGRTVDQIFISAGTTVTIPIRCMNRSTAIWGPDAKEFIPERWLDEASFTPKTREIQGHRHLLTFVDGPRTCLGKSFALAEFKAVLSVLIRNYTFEFRDGPNTEIGTVRGILPRPKVAGEEGSRVPLRVRRVD